MHDIVQYVSGQMQIYP